MAKILVISEVNAENVKNVTYEILGKLNNHEVHVAIVGDIPAQAKAELAKFGANHIHSLKGAGLEQYTPEGYSNALGEFIKSLSFDFVFTGATSLGKDLLPRLAASFDAGMATDVTNFNFSGDTFNGTRPMFAGKVYCKVEINGPKPHFVSVRPNALGLPQSTTQGAGKVSENSVASGNIRATIKEILKGASEKLDLTEANIIVSGGRAMKNADNFKLLNQLADVIGATVGASRAAVDSGFAPHSMQVGQTGKTVSPTLYIACGISGAIQHLAGMRTSKVIVAINADPDAPIFTKADYGIVGDLFEIVPIMTEEFKKILK